MPERGADRSAHADRLVRSWLLPVVAALAFVGLWLAIEAFSGDPGHAGAGLPTLGEAVPTSFGAITVVDVELVAGLTSEQLGGMTHGIGGLVTADSTQVEVSLLVANTGDKRVKVSPAQFRLVVGEDGASVAPAGSTARPISLAPGASMDAVLSFVVPRGGDAISIAYADPGSATAWQVPLGGLGDALDPVEPDASVPDAGPAHTH